MKKISKIFILVLMVLFIKIDYVGAIKGNYNGNGKPGAPGSGECPSCSKTEYCVYNNKNHATIRISLVEYKKVNGTWRRWKIGHSIYHSDNDYRIEYVHFNKLNENGTGGESTYTGTKNSRIAYNKKWFATVDKKGYHNIDKNKIKSELVTKKGNITNFAWELIEDMTDEIRKSDPRFESKSDLAKYLKKLDRQGKSKEEKYRILIEPVVSLYKCNHMYYYTSKGVAGAGLELTNSTRICELAHLLYTSKKDIGISAGKYWGTRDACSESGKKNARANLKNRDRGEGYNILKIWDEDPTLAVCDYRNDAHFKKNNQKKDPIKPTAKTGSGPHKENCCNLELKEVWEAYQDQYEDEHKKKVKNKDEFKKFFASLHPECFKVPDVKVKTKKAVCGSDNESTYTRTHELSELDLIVLAAREKGTSQVAARQTSGEHGYLRDTIMHAKIYCSEDVKLTLPTEYKNTLSKGAKLEWPTYDNADRTNGYPLTLNGKASCYINYNFDQIIEAHKYVCRYYCCVGCAKGGCCSYCPIYCRNYAAEDAEVRSINRSFLDWYHNTSNHYDVNGKFTLKYDDKEYGNSIIPLERYSTGQSSYKITGINPNMDLLDHSSKNFSISQKSKYRIQENIYRYVLKLTGQKDKSVSYKPTGQNYVDVGYGNLPISLDAKKGKYNVTIFYSNLGGFKDYRFATTSPTPYICPYEVDESTPEEYVCPIGTKHAGMDLIPFMTGAYDSKTYTYKEAVEKFCDDSSIVRYVCPPNTSHAGLDITAEVKVKGYDRAVNDNCKNPDTETPYKCPSGTDLEGAAITKSCYNNYNCKMLKCNIYTCPDDSDRPGQRLNEHISDCVKWEKLSLSAAYKKTVERVCYAGKDKIIYRVIDLKNPFPGKQGNGRLAGYNWRNDNLIKKYITNNRGVKTNKVYNKSKAMYHFKLTPSDIRQIRAYNKNNKYSDFKLTCKSSNGRECISSFVHNTSYGLKSDSQCYNSGSFNSCR